MGGLRFFLHCDATNQYYGECRRQDNCRVVRGHGPGKYLQNYTKNTRFRAFWKQVLVLLRDLQEE